MCLAPSTPRPFSLRSRVFSDLLKFRTIGTHEEKSGQSTVSIGQMHAQITSNERAAASGCTYDCGSALATALAPSVPILFLQRLRLVNLLKNKIEHILIEMVGLL